LGAFLSFFARGLAGLPLLVSLMGFSFFSFGAAFAFLGAGVPSPDAGRFFGFGAGACDSCVKQARKHISLRHALSNQALACRPPMRQCPPGGLQHRAST